MKSLTLLFLLFGILGLGIFDFRPANAAYYDDVCTVNLDAGQACPAGRSLVPNRQYFFNSNMGKCMPFMYLGCGGNRNRFSTIPECSDSCQIEHYKRKNKKEEDIDSTEYSRTYSDCKEAPDPGPCKALIPQWFYDYKDETCKGFTYGGCMGNKNRFNTEELCQRHCIERN